MKKVTSICKKKNNAKNREFGLVFCAVFSLYALYPLLAHEPIRLGALAISISFLIPALIYPGILAPANWLWMKIGELLHRITSPVLLGIVFYLAVLPTGLLMRLFGKDPLRLQLDQATNSYWILREPPGPDAESLHNQF